MDRVWEDFLQYCEDERDVRKERRKEKVAAALDILALRARFRPARLVVVPPLATAEGERASV